MSGVVLGGFQNTGNRCLLAFDNLFEQGEVTVSNNTLGNPNEDDGHPVENLYDWLTTDFYKPNELGTIYVNLTLSNPAQADYLAFYAHDLHTTGCSIKLQYWNGSAWLDASDTIAPASGAPYVSRFAVKTASQWRLVVEAPTDIPSIGVVAFGKCIETPRGVYIGYTPPKLARRPKLINSESEGGKFLGRSVVHQGFETSLVLQYAPDQWVRDYWLPFVKHAEQKPFFYLWNTDDFPNEAAFCWTTPDINPPSHTHYGFMGTSLPIRGVDE